ncbi:O-antigen ligase family protein [Limimaricola cinnabarinus]|uniref:O-antigen ligase family protein n=1 Tax=Limimaricola cinnabarinus TaxID=1125964 RepID=UPI002FE22A82
MNYISEVTIIRTLYLILSVTAAFLAFTPGSARWLAILLLIWGSFIAVYQVVIGIDYDRSLGQHYLTVSLPIGISLTGAMVTLLAGRIKVFQFIILLGLAGVHLISLATLFSRSALIYPPIAASLVFILSIASRRAPLNVLRQGWRILFVALISLPFTGAIEFKQLNRLTDLSNFEDELRWRIFVEAAEHIQQSPFFGHGVDASSALIGVYSHNIFLEVALTGGLILFMPFLAIMVIYTMSAKNIIARAEIDSTPLILLGMSLFALLQWNTSFDLLTSYVPLVLVAAIGSMTRGRFQ